MSKYLTGSLVALCSLAFACSSNDGGGITIGSGGASGSGASANDGGLTGTAASNGSGASAGSGVIVNVGGMGGLGTGGGAGGNGMPELCDGLDNDANGIIDDVDAGNDGVCDCLSIATLGQIGPWSNGGNIFASWLDARSPQGAVALDDQVLTAELLAPFQVIVALHVGTTAVSNGSRTAAAHHAFSGAEADAFRAWVEAGGGVMTTIGYTNNEAEEVVNVNELLGTIGMGYSTTRLDLSDFVRTWGAHPVTEGVANIFTDNGVEPEGSGSVVAHGGSDRVALAVAEPGDGRAVVWGDEWITYDSEWADVDDQQVELFWLNILKWLSPPNECQVPIPPSVVR